MLMVCKYRSFMNARRSLNLGRDSLRTKWKHPLRNTAAVPIFELPLELASWHGRLDGQLET